ncbi:unannotated protein [freshwater metagenome]|uniref:Unannotated protein n=1 Tax=freshwater metagenome TaxID=449393 RepID=A0A6J7SMH1_9ZZZZ
MGCSGVWNRLRRSRCISGLLYCSDHGCCVCVHHHLANSHSNPSGIHTFSGPICSFRRRCNHRSGRWCRRRPRKSIHLFADGRHGGHELRLGLPRRNDCVTNWRRDHADRSAAWGEYLQPTSRHPARFWADVGPDSGRCRSKFCTGSTLGFRGAAGLTRWSGRLAQRCKRSAHLGQQCGAHTANLAQPS